MEVPPIAVPEVIPDQPPAVEILHLDAELVVVNKPSGSIVHRGWASDRDPMLQRVRDALGQHVYPAHRLDRGTSGVLLFALNSEMAAELGRAFAAGEVKKRYLALVRGLPPESLDLDYPLRNEAGESQPAFTTFRRLQSCTLERCSLVEAYPRTGRQHQIRRHLKHLSHPIIGDVKYGKGPINRHYRETYGLHRLALHAASIGLHHPATQCWLEIQAPLPLDLLAPLSALDLASSL